MHGEELMLIWRSTWKLETSLSRLTARMMTGAPARYHRPRRCTITRSSRGGGAGGLVSSKSEMMRLT